MRVAGRSVAFPVDEAPASVCILRLSAIGDTCHTLPVVRTLQSAWPDCRMTWVIGKVEHRLMHDVQGVEFVVLDKSLGWRGYAALRRALRQRRFDVLLHMHASMRANIASLFVRAPLRLGFDRARARDKQWLFTNETLPPTPRQHVMDGLFEFAERLGIRYRRMQWDIPLSADDRRLAATVRDASRPLLLISPCSSQRFRNYRNWPVERYAQVADYAATRFGASVVLTGGPSELEARYGEELCALTQHCTPRNLIGQTTLKQLLALIAAADVVLCPDSGPAHMATAVRTPVIGLYATSNRFRTGPYFSQSLVVDKYPQAVERELGKPVAEIRWGGRVRHPEAMELIEVAEVNERLEQVLGEPGKAQVE